MRRFMKGKLKNSPAGFRGCDVSGLEEGFDFIYMCDSITINNFDSSGVKSLENIFVDIFYRFDRSADFNVDMRAIFRSQIWRIRNDVFIGGRRRSSSIDRKAIPAHV
jgi:hypothetical protein